MLIFLTTCMLSSPPPRKRSSVARKPRSFLVARYLFRMRMVLGFCRRFSTCPHLLVLYFLRRGHISLSPGARTNERLAFVLPLRDQDTLDARNLCIVMAGLGWAGCGKANTIHVGMLSRFDRVCVCKCVSAHTLSRPCIVDTGGKSGLRFSIWLYLLGQISGAWCSSLFSPFLVWSDLHSSL